MGGGKSSSGGCIFFFISIATALVPAFGEYFVPIVFPLFKPILLREKRVPPRVVIIKRLGFQSTFFTQIISSFPRLFVYFIFSRRQNLKNIERFNFLIIRTSS